MAAIQVKVTSAGNQVGNLASITVDGKQVAMSYSRGLNVVVIDQMSGQIVSTQTYDTASSQQQAELFADMIEDLPVGRIVVIAVKDDGSSQLSERAKRACEMLGSALIFLLGYQQSWGMVGQKGAPAGTAMEALEQTQKVELELEQPLASPEQIAYRVRIWSAGFLVGNDFWIEYNGQRLHFEGIGRGLNVAVFDALTCQLVSQHSFDTYISADASQQFATLIEGLPDGQYVAVAVKDEAVWHLTEQAKSALESLGSGLIRQLQYRNSYAFFGRKKANLGSVAESLSSSMPVLCESWMAPNPEPWRGFSVSTLCATPSTGALCSTFVNGIAVGLLAPGISGMLVTVIDEQTGITLETAAFDPQHDSTASASLAQLIHSASMGRIIAISSTMGTVSHLQPAAVQACTLIGSDQIFTVNGDQSACWCILGRKGSAPGSVPECSGRCSTALQYWVPDGSAPRLYADLRLISAGFDIGSGASIKINGHDLDQWSRGMNVAVFDEQIGDILQTATYDTYGFASASDAFAQLLEGLPAGRIVAIAAMDEASKSLTERARLACESIGSALIRRLTFRGSWAIVGVKGAAIGSVAETVGSHLNSSCVSYQLYTAAARTVAGVSVRTHSAGFDVGNNAFFTVNGQRVDMAPGRGLNVVTIDRESGQVIERETFDTYQSSQAADAFAALIEQLPFGRIVAVAVMDEASKSLTERAKRACRMIGSESIDQLGTRNSWAIVGVKGVGPGSVSEVLNAQGATEVEIWLPLAQSRKRAFFFWGLFVALFVVILAYYMLDPISDKPRPSYNSSLPTPAPAPSPTPAPAPPRHTRRRAVFVGIDYANVSGLGLKGLPSQILEKLQTDLVNLGVFAAKDCTFLYEKATNPKLTPTKTNVLAAIDELVQGAVKGDVLYFHYLGHGNRDTSNPNIPELIITLSDSLYGRNVTYDYELQQHLKSVSPEANLTLIFHCCFGGGMIDASDQGRGIALGAVNELTPANLSLTGRNMSNIIGTRLAQTYNKANSIPMDLPTYKEMLDYIAAMWPTDSPTLNANQAIYHVEEMLFLEPFFLQLSGLVYLQDIGDVGLINDEFAGTRGQARRLEGFQIKFDPPIPGLSMRYMAHLQGSGDVPWVDEGQYIGSRGQGLRLEGFAIELRGPLKNHYTVRYMAHIQNRGDTAFFENGQYCGTRGESLSVEGIEVSVQPR